VKTWVRLREFLLRDIWTLDLARASTPRRAIVHALRALVLLVEGLLNDRVSVWASSLTYITLISVVPFLALCIAVGARLGVPGKVVQLLVDRIPPKEYEVISGIASSFEKVPLRTVGVLSVFLLILAATKGLASMETAFNAIWGVERGRGVWRRFADYLAVAIVGPVLLLCAMGLTASLLSSSVILRLGQLPVAGDAIWLALRFVPYLALWVAFTLLYLLLPNTDVKFLPALAGALVAGTVWQLAQWTYFRLELGLSRYNLVYGAFAAIPVFLVWVYVSWMIVLVGAEVSYAVQTAKTYGFERKRLTPSVECLEETALRISLLLAYEFERGNGPLSPEAIAQDIRAPLRIVRHVLCVLAERGIVSRLESRAYQIAKPARLITAADVLAAVRQHGDHFSATATAESAGSLPAGCTQLIRDLRTESFRTSAVPLSELLARAGGTHS